MKRRELLIGLTFALATPARAARLAPAAKLIAAAEAQIGLTLHYDPAYTKLSYPGGDVPMERGVCTAVIIRAYRKAFAVDLQKLVHEDMKANFADYPKNWGLKATDINIDHRRVPNLQKFFARKKAALPLPDELSGFVAGDIVTMMLPGHLPHIGIVSDTLNEAGSKRLVIHNIGGGAAKDDVLGLYELTGRYRYLPSI